MGDIVQFPFERMPREFVIAKAAELAAGDPGDVMVMEPVGDCAVVQVAGAELWFSLEEFSDMILQWAQMVSDQAAELARVAEEARNDAR